MNRLPLETRVQTLGMLVEGTSMRATSRLADISINTVTKLLEDVGAACAAYQDKALRNLRCRRVQCDEIWSFCYAKEKHVPPEREGQFGYGDVWTWVGMDADSKLTASWMIGRRDAQAAATFITDLKGRLAHRVQLTTDGLKVYLEAIEGAFGSKIDYAMLIKLYGEGPDTPEHKYSPSRVISASPSVVTGKPDLAHISTSYIERQNLTMRMSMRRFTRLTNAFSKKVENLAHAVALHFMFYNFARIHKTLRVTPAMEAGISDHVWTLEEIAALDVAEAPKKRGPYKKREISN
jgi:IS1 family transposase